MFGTTCAAFTTNLAGARLARIAVSLMTSGTTMKVSYNYPPNYETIIAAIPAVAQKKTIIFTYGDTIYNPGGGRIPPELEMHEATHWAQQQALGIDEWWGEYLRNVEFRFLMELEAYRAQYQAVHGRDRRRELLNTISKDLSSAWYGNLCTKKEAKERIRAKA